MHAICSDGDESVVDGTTLVVTGRSRFGETLYVGLGFGSRNRELRIRMLIGRAANGDELKLSMHISLEDARVLADFLVARLATIDKSTC